MRIAAILVAALVSGSCASSCGRATEQEAEPEAPCVRSEPQVLPATELCAGDLTLDQGATAQLLIDTSGSMAGFMGAPGRKGSVRRVYDWVASAMSSLGGDQGSVSLGRVAAFNRADGFLELTGPGGVDALRARGDTSIDTAVQEAEKGGLTLILTDGVPYVGSNTSGDCSAGSDTGCVARRLLEYLHTRTTAGIWIVPTVAPFDGPFFTEGQDIQPDASAARVVEENVKKSFPRSDVRLTLRPGASPPMTYRGPRVLLLVVLAADETLGRAMVQRMLERAPLAQAQVLGSEWGAFDNRQLGLGVLTPVEVYPGYLAPVRRISGDVIGEPEGTIDVQASAGRGDQIAVEVGCRAEDAGRASYRLGFAARDASARACFPMHSLASVTLSLCADETASADERQALGSLVPDASLASAAGPSTGGGREDEAFVASLELACGTEGGPACSSGGKALRLAATMGYAPTADRLAVAAASAQPGRLDAVEYVAGLSTTELPTNPHKVLGLTALLTQVLRGVSSGAGARPVASVSVCERQTRN